MLTDNLTMNKPTLRSHTHLQFAPANTPPKIAKEYVFATANRQTGRKRTPKR
jgi:hypothetical protein